MKKITILTIILIILLSALSTSYGATSNNLRARFTESDVTGTNFKEITISPYYNDGDDTDTDTYYIYLPSGYFVEGTSASYVADKDGEYPFTIYDGSYGNHKKTFTYNVELEEPGKDKNKLENGLLYSDSDLLYDYEKKQIILNMVLDKQRTVTTPEGTTVTNEINYYIKNIENNTPYNLSITVDDIDYNYKIIKSGEFYLLIYISPVNYNDYSTIVEYYGYNFTNNESYLTYPSKDIYSDNGSYEVLVKSSSSQHVFNFDITGIDFRRPSVDVEFGDDDTFTIEAEDDLGLDYMITFDGKYIDLRGTAATYKHTTPIVYKGEYIFTVVDEMGNKTVKNININSKRRTPSNKHKIELEVHDTDDIEDLFKNKGIEYEKQDDIIRNFENILPAYMNGKGPDNFNPDSPISRAEIVTIFCRLNNLPYDSNAYLKSKFTDIDIHWARDYISMGSSKKYVSGYKDKTFKPDNNVTRAEFCQMLTKISAYKKLLNALPASSNYNFTDINEHWAEKEVIKIASRNLLTSEDMNFYPDKAITRGEVVHAINKLYGFSPTYLELGHINSLYNKYYDFKDIQRHKYYSDIIISVVGMYREILN